MYQLINRIARKIKYPKQPNLLNRMINLMYYSPGTSIIRNVDVDYVVVGGSKFYSHEQLWCVTQPDWEWWLSGVKETDVCLDIGADIGGITIPLAKKVKKVYSVEPLYFKELERNIELNSLANVEVIMYALGEEGPKNKIIEFGSKSSDTTSISFSRLLENIRRDQGKLDFLKIDIEGDEWQIKPGDLLGIREIRIEFHIRRGRARKDYNLVTEWNTYLSLRRYKVDVRMGLHEETILFRDTVYFKASLKECTSV